MGAAWSGVWIKQRCFGISTPRGVSNEREREERKRDPKVKDIQFVDGIGMAEKEVRKV